MFEVSFIPYLHILAPQAELVTIMSWAASKADDLEPPRARNLRFTGGSLRFIRFNYLRCFGTYN